MEIILENQNGEIVDLSKMNSKKILFFYPKANTPG
jgi:peroxiredoxin